MAEKKLVLASASPRRKAILENVGYKFTVIKPEADEISTGDPAEVVLTNARLKADAAVKMTDGVIICADTVVAYNGEILGKPKTPKRAFEMLSFLSGTTHRVLSGYCITDGNKRVDGVVETIVRFRNLHDDEIQAYIDSGSPLDKAGAYGIQDFGGIYVEGIDGDFYNVMGLPLCTIVKILRDEFDIVPF